MRSDACDSIAHSTERHHNRMRSLLRNASKLLQRGSRGPGLLALAVTALMVMPALPASALPAGKHTSEKSMNIDTPVYVGFDGKKKAHHFIVTARWLPDACDDKFCWPAKEGDLGSDDAIRIQFSPGVDFKAMSLRLFDACNHQTFSRSMPVENASFNDAAAKVDDKVFIDKFKMPGGGPTESGGLCGTEEMPTGPAPTAPASRANWYNLKSASIQMDVWVVPNISYPGLCPKLKVKAGYIHTWSDKELSWSAGVGYPFSVGVGVGATDKEHSWEKWQNGDAHSDPDLFTKPLCEGGRVSTPPKHRTCAPKGGSTEDCP
jgi:hypothetical protein